MMMVLAWVVYCVTIAALLTLGAAAWERSARWSGGSSRWGWLAAAAGSVTLPWLLRLVPDRSWAEAVPSAMPMLRLDALMSAAEPVAAAWSAAEVAVFAWAAVSLLMVAWVASLLLRLARVSRRWRPVELEGGRVLLSESAGPAALGVRRGVVVLPSWVMGLDEELRGLLLRHERSHVEAGDPRMLLGGLILLAAMPWNPVLWLQVLQLRNAIELDCDARVLASGVDPERYGSLLLEVGRRRSSHALVMATFSEPRVFLEQRIRRIAQWPLERRRGRAALFAVAALLLVAAAASARDPLYGAAAAVPAAPAADPAVHGAMVSDTPPPVPKFTPMTQRPELINGNEVKAALESNYPPLLRDAGIGGTTAVYVFVDTLGRPLRTLVSRTSSYPALDEAAVSVAAAMKFSPALNRTKKVAVWVEIPVVFNPGNGSLVPAPPTPPTPPRAAPGEPPRPPAAAPRPPAAAPRPPAPPVGVPPTAPPPAPAAPRNPPPAAPVAPPAAPVPPSRNQERSITPMDRRPELINRDEVARALMQNYPPVLRDAGIGGSPVVWFHIDAEGVVQELDLSKSSGYPALDQAALNVARTLRFTPAQLEGRDVPVWVEIPIVFTAK